MPRKVKKSKPAAVKGSGDEVVSKNEPKLKTDSDEEEQADDKTVTERKPEPKKAGKSETAKSKPKPKKGKKVSSDESEASDTEASEEPPKSKKDSKAEGKDSNKRKRAGNGDEEPSSKVPRKELLNKVDTDMNTLVVTSTKCTADGKSANLKIASWNVAGIRAVVKRDGFVDYMKKEQADIVCLQETKCEESKLPPEVYIKGYHTFWCSGTKAGYAGVALYSKEKPLNVKYGLGKQEYDSEGRLITAEYEKYYIIAIYVPNAGSGLKNLSKRMQWDKDLRDYLKSLDQKKPVIVCGDMNVAHQPIDLARPKTNTKSPGFTQEERDGMTALLEAGFVDTFRHLYPDKTDAYTYWTYMGQARSRNVGWRLDYYIVSKRFVDNVCDNVIRSEVYGSDHCPIVLFASV